MAPIRQAALDHEARRWLRPDWRRFFRPGSQHDPLYQYYERIERKYDPGQPRVPAGVSQGGQWTSGEGADASHRVVTPLERPRPTDNQAQKPVKLAGDITGFTRHGINQTITRGVSPGSIHDAVTAPLQIVPQQNGTTRYVGKDAVVVLNPAGGVVRTGQNSQFGVEMTERMSILTDVKTILLRDWDPIGIRDVPQARDEYDSYARELAAMLAAGASVGVLARRLLDIETETMGLQPHHIRADVVAQKLRQLA